MAMVDVHRRQFQVALSADERRETLAAIHWRQCQLLDRERHLLRHSEAEASREITASLNVLEGLRLKVGGKLPPENEETAT